MSETRCACTKPDGDPCAARALPNSAFCLFHDPAHAEARAAGRSQGGSTPRRRSRRLPRLLDHMHIAEIMGELLIDALNEPVPLDNKRLHSLTHLCQVLLKAVGTPKDSFLAHYPHDEPPANEEHLLRLYTILSSDLETTPPAPPSTGSNPEPPASTPEHRTPNTEHLNTEHLNPDPEPLNARMPERLTPLTPSGEYTLYVKNAPAYRDHACFLGDETPPVSPEQDHQVPEQDSNKLSTSAPGTTTPLGPLPPAAPPFLSDSTDDPAADTAAPPTTDPSPEIAAQPPSVDPSPLVPGAAPEFRPFAPSSSRDHPIAQPPPPVAQPAGEPVRRYTTFGPLR